MLKRTFPFFLLLHPIFLFFSFMPYLQLSFLRMKAETNTTHPLSSFLLPSSMLIPDSVTFPGWWS